ncbi:MAG: phosphoglycerate kinase, partial [Pseudomonadota bacterium]
MSFKTLDHFDLAGKRALIRVDVNAPVADGRVTDDTRLRAIAPTIGHVLKQGGKPILLTHFGRPKGETIPELSVSILRPALELVLGVPVDFCGSTVGAEAESAVAAMR